MAARWTASLQARFCSIGRPCASPCSTSISLRAAIALRPANPARRRADVGCSLARRAVRGRERARSSEFSARRRRAGRQRHARHSRAADRLSHTRRSAGADRSDADRALVSERLARAGSAGEETRRGRTSCALGDGLDARVVEAKGEDGEVRLRLRSFRPRARRWRSRLRASCRCRPISLANAPPTRATKPIIRLCSRARRAPSPRRRRGCILRPRCSRRSRRAAFACIA